MPDPIQMLKDDHRKVKRLFKDFEKRRTATTKRRIVDTVRAELDVHTKIEERYFYPAVRKADAKETVDLIEEAEEEHHVVDVLLKELAGAKTAEPDFDAKFKVLTENVEHHIEEEEGEMFPKARKLLSKDQLSRIGEQMSALKLRLTGGRRPARPRPTTRTTSRRTTRASRPKTTGKSGRPTTSRTATRRPAARKTPSRRPASRRRTPSRAR